VAEAATFVVNTWTDSNDGVCTHPRPALQNAVDCSFREAANAANANPGPDTIILSATLRHFDGASDVTQTLAEVSTSGAAEDGNASGDIDVWDTVAGTTLTISGGGITGAYAVGMSAPGGSIYLAPGAAVSTLALEHVVLDGDSDIPSGIIAQGYSVYNGWGSVTTVNSIISGRCTGTATTSLGGNGVPSIISSCVLADPFTEAPLPASFPLFTVPVAYYTGSLTRLHDLNLELWGPPVINHPNCVATAITEDQRGSTRPVGANCDPGAMEQ
jgi:CSLREA domain-containing protein